eukprot:5912209-Amphidinium_carterae.1
MEKWEEQVRAYERKKDSAGQEEKIPESIKMATLESLCPQAIEQHLKLNHARLRTYDELRTEVLMLLETNVGASLKAPEAAAGTPADDPMDTSALWKGKGKGKDKGQKGKQDKKSGTGKFGAAPAASASGAAKDVVCHNCGRKGHKNAECWRAGGGAANATKGKGKGQA